MAWKPEPYRPTPDDLSWAREVATIVRSGGVVGTSAGVYQVDHERHEFTLLCPADPFENPLTLITHHRHSFVWAVLGWRVLPEVDWDSLEVSDTRGTRPPEVSDDEEEEK